MEIIEKKVGKRQAAYILYTGSYEEIPVLMGEVVGFLMAKGLQMMGPPFGIYFNSPEEVSEYELVYEIGIPYLGETEESGRVKLKTTPSQLVLSTVYRGPYSECGIALGAIAKHAYQNGYEIIGPPMEIYLSDPNETPENQLITEICFPIVKK
jgi:effector-binding domain-containing protein